MENKTHINWYPGHMTKARRKIEESLKAINIVVEIVDSRIPVSSRNPDFEDLFKGKKRILILNKKDLADDRITDKWVNYYKNQGVDVFAISSIKNNKNKILDFIKKSAAPIIEKYKAKGVNKVIRCMIVGIPNSGKSSFINMIYGKAKVKAEDRPGVTRANQWIKIDSMLEVMDTPGVLWPKLSDQDVAVNLSCVGSIKDDILDIEEIACLLLQKLAKRYPERITERYGIELDEQGYIMLERICQKRGFIIKKDDYDYERGAKIVLDEFRGGKLGKISLEEPNFEV